MMIRALINDLLFLPISTIVCSELTSLNPLFCSRLACSRLSGHIQPVTVYSETLATLVLAIPQQTVVYYNVVGLTSFSD